MRRGDKRGKREIALSVAWGDLLMPLCTGMTWWLRHNLHKQVVIHTDYTVSNCFTVFSLCVSAFRTVQGSLRSSCSNLSICMTRQHSGNFKSSSSNKHITFLLWNVPLLYTDARKGPVLSLLFDMKECQWGVRWDLWSLLIHPCVVWLYRVAKARWINRCGHTEVWSHNEASGECKGKDKAQRDDNDPDKMEVLDGIFLRLHSIPLNT